MLANVCCLNSFNLLGLEPNPPTFGGSTSMLFLLERHTYLFVRQFPLSWRMDRQFLGDVFSKNGGAQILVSVSVSGLFFEKPMVKRGTLIFEIRSYPLHVHSTSFYHIAC